MSITHINTRLASTIRAVNPSIRNKKPKSLYVPFQQNRVLVVATPSFVPAVTMASLRSTNICVEFATTLDHVFKCLIDQKFNVCVLFEDSRTFEASYVIKLFNLFTLSSHPQLKIIVIPSTSLKERAAMPNMSIHFLAADARPKAIAEEVQKALIKKIVNV